MKKKIADLRIGDTVEINGKLYDVYDEPTKLENGDYCFVIAGHGMIEKVSKMAYITPVDLAYEVSSNFENGEITVVAKEME